MHEALDSVGGCRLEQVASCSDIYFSITTLAVGGFAIGSSEMIDDGDPFGGSFHRHRVSDIRLEDLNPRTFVRKQLLEGTGLDSLKNDIGLSKSDFDLNSQPERERDPLDFWTRPPVDFDAT